MLYGPDERTAGEVTVRNMHSGEQARVPLAEAASYLCEALEESGLRPDQEHLGADLR
ncbi:hypothetical protein GCM10023347_23350 [Streptomyces chumphonensis]|uniref:His/Gly/Thr/Pro-type tRNA ligase C-terminal domain-containing protein n=1 Tax=Streptomyces chumphonensis TaxID=1214925 RepID=UPI0031F0082B